MSKGIDLRRKLFKVFSRNLSWVKEHSSIKFTPDFTNGYICPLCFDVFFEKDLGNSESNFLTIEDVPPVSLGGKPKILTCKNCNSFCGHQLDNHLNLRLLEMDFHEFLPNSKSKTKFDLNGSVVNGYVEFDSGGVMKLNLQTERSNPVSAQKFMSDFVPNQKNFFNPIFQYDKFFSNDFKSADFTIEKPAKSDERRAEIALLRIGYLYCYSLFGNGFLINGNLYKIREQIMNPEKEILPRCFWIKYDFPEDMIGLNIIKEPRELRSFLAIFNLKTPSKLRQFAVMIPGISTPGIDVYENIEKLFKHNSNVKQIHFEVEHLADRDYLNDKNLTFFSNSAWNKYATDENLKSI